ncbi:MAG: pyridoxamine 5'-phosphate oxidase family protein [Desulfobulbia bacterium]
MRERRRKDRSIEQEEALEILREGEFGVLSTSSVDGEPYGVPLNYCVIDCCILFHCALEGHKIDNIDSNKSISFCVVGKTEIMPEKFGTKYESVIVSGNVEEVFGFEKQEALEGLLHKYSSGYIEDGTKYIEGLIEKTKVYKIGINNLSGKARRK